MRDAFGSPQSLLVLGGTSEIAEATARELIGRRLRRVVLAARDVDRAEQVAGRLRERGAHAEVVAFDATDVDAHEGLIDRVFDEHGDFDAVLIAFGVFGDQHAAAHSAALARELVQATYVGAVSVAVPVVRRLRAQGHGVLVAVSSVAAQRARPSEYVYASAKAGLDAYFQGLADSLHGSGVHVTIVRPAYVRTRMSAGRTPPPWAVGPDDVARRIVEGMQREMRIVWAPRWIRPAAWLLSVLPSAVLRRLPL